MTKLFAMKKHHKNCRNFGMPLSKDQKGGCSAADGTKSIKICSHLYKNRKFKNPDITMGEMKKLVKGKLTEMGFPGFIAGFFTHGIPKLEQ